MSKPLILKNLEEVLIILEKIKNAKHISVQGIWDLNQNLIHCAHSIEFALSGYPYSKPRIFQKTIGKLVFNYFDWKGFMRHGTNDLIPGEDHLVNLSAQNGIQQLEEAILKFDSCNRPLCPHRFYGQLSKQQYAKAHTLHIANHLELIQFLD
ncbi:MAG: DUF1569 domain-containing protein [Saprospiraceae bacterium]|nr:DUF1569 domain-containing protein [Saprospiraceae bacterium]